MCVCVCVSNKISLRVITLRCGSVWFEKWQVYPPLLPHITTVSLLEMQVSYTMFPELVIHSLTHFGPYFHGGAMTGTDSASTVCYFPDLDQIAQCTHVGGSLK